MKLRDMVEILVRELVDKSDAVKVKEVKGDKLLVLELNVDKSDVGKVIGKKGQTAHAMRTLVNAIGAKQRQRVMLEIIE